jgi:hypothetical protein
MFYIKLNHKPADVGIALIVALGQKRTSVAGNRPAANPLGRPSGNRVGGPVDRCQK